MPFITVVPAVRTVPGVEEFDYAVTEGHGLALGDLICVTFRKRPIPALVVRFSDTSQFASRALHLDHPAPLLRLGKKTPELLRRTAERTLSSQPSVLFSWIRHVPKRAPADDRPRGGRQTGFPLRETRYVADRWTAKNGLLETARTAHGSTLILTPWQHRADALGKILHCPVLHSDLAMGQAWSMIRGFVDGSISLLVATRLGAWLGSQAGTVLIDEPENDDFKQDELAPRFDARWIAEQCAELHPDLSLISFSTTPRLDSPSNEWQKSPTIELNLRTEPKLLRGASVIRDLSEQTLSNIEDALHQNQSVTILHPIRGEQARITCRDCGWSAACVACGFALSLMKSQASCARCGRKNELPHLCPSCSGSDFSRGRAGADRLSHQLVTRFPTKHIEVLDMGQMQQATLAHKSLVIVTELSLIGGITEDIRRRERLVLAWRRLAATLESRESNVVVQGPEDLLTECREWLTAEGVETIWKKELAERASFDYPPACRLIKILITSDDSTAQNLFSDIQKILPTEMKVRGPFAVPFRAASRGERYIIHLITPKNTKDAQLVRLLERFNRRAIIDLDPTAFFS